MLTDSREAPGGGAGPAEEARTFIEKPIINASELIIFHTHNLDKIRRLLLEALNMKCATSLRQR
jgi:hypothetical protein